MGKKNLRKIEKHIDKLDTAIRKLLDIGEPEGLEVSECEVLASKLNQITPLYELLCEGAGAYKPRTAKPAVEQEDLPLTAMKEPGRLNTVKRETVPASQCTPENGKINAVGGEPRYEQIAASRDATA